MTAGTAAASALGPGGEFDRIRAILGDPEEAPVSEEIRIGPGDDAAVLANGIVLTTDMAVEGIHFRFDWLSPYEAGYRAAAGGVSDLAAMAAEPVGVLVSLAVPGDGALALEVMRGVKALAGTVRAPLLGGDLTRSPGPCVIDVVSVGRAERLLLRSSARPGDELWVTGRLGGAAGALRVLAASRSVPVGLRTRLAAPRPRVEEARWLAELGVRCGLDLSDGLAGDAAHLAAASGVRVILDAHAIPVDDGLGPDTDGLELALHGGEDYELLVSAAPGSIESRATEFAERFEIEITRVGRVVEGSGVVIVEEPGAEPRPLVRGGYDHFAGDARP